MKKIILFSFLILTTAALLNINIGQAQTKSLKAETLENLQAIVEKLLQQVQELQARLKQVKATQSENATKPIITIQPAEQFITLEELPDSPKVSCVLPVLQISSRHKSVYLLQMLLKQHGSYPEGFITLISFSMETEDMKKEVVVGSGSNVYASKENLYIAQTKYPYYYYMENNNTEEKTVIHKFKLDKGNIEYLANGEVKGYILNQFSMDEFDNHFRIATTRGELFGGWVMPLSSGAEDTEPKSENNIYVLDENLDLVGSLEGLAPGEKIYSVRFMNEKAYVVTFKKIDPLFVIDLSNPENPNVLGKLKIPGYSDYLHPIDDTHLIGIGKEAVDAETDLVEQRNLDFAWYQGVKIAIFDVSDVENPIELYKVVIGDRGTDSPVLYNHKAFLYDKEKELLVIPILLAEYDQKPQYSWEQGDYKYQGAYVYGVNLDDGFELRGRITHFDEVQDPLKIDYGFWGEESIKRSLYLGGYLYTVSDKMIKVNELSNLDLVNKIIF